MPLDLELYHAYSLVSDHAKLVFQAIDPDGFAFVRCDVTVPQGKYDGPDYWLCDVTRVLDVLDEANSRLGIAHRKPTPDDPRETFPSFAGARYVSFKEDMVGNARVFRLASYLIYTVICDDVLKDACKAADLKGVRFQDASKL